MQQHIEPERGCSGLVMRLFEVRFRVRIQSRYRTCLYPSHCAALRHSRPRGMYVSCIRKSTGNIALKPHTVRAIWHIYHDRWPDYRTLDRIHHPVWTLLQDFSHEISTPSPCIWRSRNTWENHWTNLSAVWSL